MPRVYGIQEGKVKTIARCMCWLLFLVCVWGGASVSWCAHPCTFMQTPRRTLGILLYLSLPDFLEASLSLNPALAASFRLEFRKPQGSSTNPPPSTPSMEGTSPTPTPPTPSTEVTRWLAAMPSCLHGYQELNSGLHACVASTFTVEFSPQPQHEDIAEAEH